jgi:predicted  nucleic acid-binding Zn-ribbon protein
LKMGEQQHYEYSETSDLKAYLVLKTQKERWLKVISDAMSAISEHEGKIEELKNAIADARYEAQELTNQLKQMEEEALK